MSTDSPSRIITKSSKSGRTPEQQAARDARKAAKAVAALLDDKAPLTKASSSEPRKRRRESVSSQKDDPALIEVDVKLPTPLSKADARAARKRAKNGQQEKPVRKEPLEPKKKNSVWIGNLSFRTTSANLKQFFQKGVEELGGEGESVTRVNLPTKLGKGAYAENKGYVIIRRRRADVRFAYVDFATPELQALALKLSEKPLEGRRVLIKLGDDHNPTPDARTPKPLTTIIAGSLPKKNLHGESSTLFVGNLPFDATEEGLRDLVEFNAKGTTTEEAEENFEGEPAEVSEDVEHEEEQKVSAGPRRGGKNSGLKKVRLGQFEDTGRCKGFAFLDFKSPLLAKVALANRKNHFYGGRRLKIEVSGRWCTELTFQYASEEATKRAGGRSAPQSGPSDKRISTVDRDSIKTSGKARSEETEATGDDVEEESVGDKRGKKWQAAGRPRPGAALAMAKRENVSVVESTGSKIVFD
ncbi:hypothetical protein P7C73_g4630, partial [Tremellales sp. Uapishka_1]